MQNKQEPDEPSLAQQTLVVIVNYCTGALTLRCLESLEPEVNANAGSKAVVVDNLSPDGSGQTIADEIGRRGWNTWVTLEQAPRNGGYAYGNNFAIRPWLGKADAPSYFWLLNPDTEVRPGALQALAAFMRSHPTVGIAGSSLEDDAGQLWPFAFRFPSMLGELDSGLRLGVVSRLLRNHVVLRPMDQTRPERVDWLPGASMIVRRSLFEDIGLMDEAYFLYYEETDYCLQACKAGWDCWYVPASRVMHVSGQSTGVTAKTDKPKRLPAYWFDSRRRYFIKNHGRAYAAASDVVWATAFCLLRIRRFLQGRADADPPRFLPDFIRHSSLWRGL